MFVPFYFYFKAIIPRPNEYVIVWTIVPPSNDINKRYIMFYCDGVLIPL